MQWIIYKHTNKINGKVYIGQTKQSPTTRWANGSKYKPHINSRNTVFWLAIKKYGWNNFEHTIIEKDIKDQATANEREIFWIRYFNSYVGFDNANGYNMTLGGNNGEHLGYTVYQIDRKSLKVIKEFSSTAEASRQFGNEGNASQIRRCCEGIKHSCKGFYWCYKQNYNENWNPKSNELVSPIFQIDDNFEIIQRFESITSCVKKTGFSAGNITSCCQRKQRKANGYFWCYAKDYNENWSPTTVSFNRNEKIYCFETNAVYASSKEAAQKTGANRGHILRCCKEKENGANGLHFCYAKDINKFELKYTKKRGKVFSALENEILKLNYPIIGLTNELFALLPNRTEASIRQQVHRLNLVMVNPQLNHYKKVYCTELDRIFNSIEEAYKFANLKDGSSITRCCKGTRKTAGGYHWQYVDE